MIRSFEEMGKTVATPFNLAGQAATPITNISKALPQAGRVVEQTALGVGRTAREAVRPAGDLLGLLRHPGANLRAAGQFAKAHPFQATGRALAYPVQYGWNTGKAAVGAVTPWARPVLRAGFSMPGMRASAMYDAYDNLRQGNYGRAAADIGTMGAFGAGIVPGLAADTGAAYLGGDED